MSWARPVLGVPGEAHCWAWHQQIGGLEEAKTKQMKWGILQGLSRQGAARRGRPAGGAGLVPTRKEQLLSSFPPALCQPPLPLHEGGPATGSAHPSNFHRHSF